MTTNIGAPFIPPDDSTLSINATGAIQIKAGTQGDIAYYGAAGAYSKLAAGTSGFILKTNGAGADPSWTQNPAEWTLLETLSPSSVTSITSSSLTAYSVYRIFFILLAGSGNPDLLLRVNGDTGTNYNSFYFASTTPTNQAGGTSAIVGTIESARQVIGEIVVYGGAAGHQGYINIATDATRNNGHTFDHAAANQITTFTLTAAAAFTGTVYIMGKN